MTFISIIFAIFFPIVFLAYWALRGRRHQNLLIVVASLFFYGWWDWRFVGLLLVSALVDYNVARRLMTTEGAQARRRLLAVSLATNLGILGFFKYCGFFVENFHALMEALGVQTSLPVLHIILPLGVSFYTFQTLGYTIDVYRRNLAACDHPVDFLAFISFFPLLVAGPIERASHLLPQFGRPRTFTLDQAVDGCREILWGLFKKMVIADNLAMVVERAYADPAGKSGLLLALATFFFAVQIYCDFSGYSHIARGTARLLGFELMRNFALPYFSRGVGEFWRRWHISLSTWFRDYLFIPLGGSQGTRARTATNILIVFVISGLWHGADWNFILWGALNGLGVAAGLYLPSRTKVDPKLPPCGDGILPSLRDVVLVSVCFGWICLGWIFFRSTSLAEAATIIGRILTLKEGSATVGGEWSAPVLLVLTALLFAIEWLTRSSQHPLEALNARINRPARWLVYSLLAWGCMILAPGRAGQFIYFNF